MPTYKYVSKSGSPGTIEAASPQEAMAKAKDIAPNSGVQDLGNAAPERTLPSMEETPTRDLPQTETKTGGLVGFAGSLAKAVNLAREKRNASLTNVVGKKFGTSLRANDFASILDEANSLSDRTFTAVLDQFEKEGEGNTFELRSVGSNLVEFELDKDGRVVNQRIVSSGGTGGGLSDDLFAPEAQRDLRQAGLLNAPQQTQIIFSNAPSEFKSRYITNGFGNAEVTPDILLKNIEEWETWYEAQKGDTIENPFVTPE